MEAIAKLRKHRTSPRKMRLVADMIRGMQTQKALATLKHIPQHAAIPMAKLLQSGIANWNQRHNKDKKATPSLYIKTIHVDQGSTLKRIQPASRGRALPIRKKSSHLTLTIAPTSVLNTKTPKTDK